MEWIEAVLLLAAVGVGVWRFAVFAGRIENDSEGMVEGRPAKAVRLEVAEHSARTRPGLTRAHLPDRGAQAADPAGAAR